MDGLEKTLTAKGSLDAVVHLREERDSIRKNGQPTAHTDKELASLRAKYTNGLDTIEVELQTKRAKAAEEVTK